MKKKLLLFLGIGYSLFLFLVPTCTYLFPDSAQYLILARALKEGKGYRMINFPGDPECEYYPPLWPLLLSFFVPTQQMNFFLGGILNIFLLCGMLYVVGKVFEYRDERIAWIIAMALGLNSQVIIMKNQFLSDPAFILFLYLSLLFWNRYKKREEYKYLILCGLTSGLAYLTRYIGILIFVSGILYLGFYKKNFKHLMVYCGICLMFYFPWEIRNLLVNSVFSGSHIAAIFSCPPIKISALHKFNFISRYFILLNYLLYDLTALIIPQPKLYIIRYLILFFIISGIGSFLVKNKINLSDLFFAIYFLFLPLWPYYQEYKRLLLPVFPFIIFYLLSGIRLFVKGRNYTFVIAVSMILYAVLSGCNVMKVRQFWQQQYYHLDDVFSWVKENIPSDEIIFASNSPLFYFYTARKTVSYRTSFESFISFWKHFRIKYIVVNNKDVWAQRYLWWRLKMLNWDLVFSSGKWLIYKKR